jgi:hypothetical protein
MVEQSRRFDHVSRVMKSAALDRGHYLFPAIPIMTLAGGSGRSTAGPR